MSAKGVRATQGSCGRRASHSRASRRVTFRPGVSARLLVMRPGPVTRYSMRQESTPAFPSMHTRRIRPPTPASLFTTPTDSPCGTTSPSSTTADHGTPSSLSIAASLERKRLSRTSSPSRQMARLSRSSPTIASVRDSATAAQAVGISRTPNNNPAEVGTDMWLQLIDALWGVMLAGAARIVT